MTTSTGACEAFVSAPIKLAAKIDEQSRRGRANSRPAEAGPNSAGGGAQSRRQSARLRKSIAKQQRLGWRPSSPRRRPQLVPLIGALALLALTGGGGVSASQHHLNSQLINHDHSGGAPDQGSLLRHHAHYLNFVPSAHFSYNEGRQANGRSLELGSNSAAPAADDDQATAASSHIYKRSSAVLMPPAQLSVRASLNPLNRRMMAGAPQLSAAPEVDRRPNNQAGKQPNWLGVGAPAASSPDSEAEPGAQREQQDRSGPAELGAARAGRDQEAASNSGAGSGRPGGPRKRQSEREAELLRQKQHIQYHDQWPSMAGKCHKRTLNFCASVLPFNTTTFPNIIGDTNRFEVKRSLPFFGFLAKSSCNKRLDELLCLLLEPPCSVHSGSAIPPCKKFCRLALEGCGEYIPATLALSSVFDCRQYPDSTDPNVCVNLAQGSKCAQDEFKCPDKTCIPRNWVCDGVRDCIFAADEANCTDSAAVPHASVCSTEEFKCDGKCVPKAWRCDGERDCQDGSDEESCEMRPKCGPDRFKCADGNGCIPKRWVCDGKAECRDGSDEMNCNQRECSESDFKCDNGICIPKLWRCDRQFDCKDGSDERQCVYPTTTTTSAPTTEAATTTTTTTTTTQSPATELVEMLQLNASSSYGLEPQVVAEAESSEPAQADQEAKSRDRANKQLEINLGGDISRIIQRERESAQQTTTVSAGPSTTEAAHQPEVPQAHSPRPTVEIGQLGSAQALKQFDYDLIPNAANLVQVNELPLGGQSAAVKEPSQQQVAAGKQPVVTQIDFVPPQQAPAAQEEQQDFERQQAALVGGHFGPAQEPPRPAQQARPAEPQRPQQQPQQQQQPPPRFPIYRSLFKSFKGHHPGQHRLQLERANGARNVVSIARRRRDRHQHNQAEAVRANQRAQQQVQFGEKQDAPIEGGSSAQVAPLMMLPLHGQQQQPQQQQALQSSDQSKAPSAGEVSGSVASYLQLLNGRYNLRLARGQPNSAISPLWS